jgi:leader peptidase (prepilin peptidase)/N-methyltransferase
MVESVFLFLIFLSIGSFLNLIAHRVVHDKNIFTYRSECVQCRHPLVWYDLVPVLSWFMLRGRCRTCKAGISLLYPAFEVISAFIFTALWYVSADAPQFLVYGLVFFGLLCAARSDLEAMVIPQIFSLGLVPLCLAAAYCGALPISLFESCVGAFIGYGILWLVAHVFKRLRGLEGLGVGDMELLALIGACFGIEGAHSALLIGSCVGLLCGGMYLVNTCKGVLVRIPFAPFLVFGALVYFFMPYLKLI